MKKTTLFLNSMVIGMALALSGCFHGETFEEWRNQHFASNPDEFPVIEPNDTQIDLNCKKYLKHISENLQNRAQFKRKVRIIASQNTSAFLNASHSWGGREAKLKALNYFAQKLISGFGTLSDFQIVNTEEEALRGLTAPSVENQQSTDIYTLAFNVTILNVEQIWKKEAYFDKRGNKYYRDKPYCKGSFAASVVLLDNHGVQKLTLDSSKSVIFAMGNSDNDESAKERCRKVLIDDVSRRLFAQYTRKTAPPAYVRRLCGNGLFAEIPLGSKYGVHPGMVVEFYQNEETTDIGTGKTALTKRHLADGVVVRAQDAVHSWVKINLYHYRRVHIGTFVRVK